MNNKEIKKWYSINLENEEDREARANGRNDEFFLLGEVIWEEGPETVYDNLGDAIRDLRERDENGEKVRIITSEEDEDGCVRITGTIYPKDLD